MASRNSDLYVNVSGVKTGLYPSTTATQVSINTSTGSVSTVEAEINNLINNKLDKTGGTLTGDVLVTTPSITDDSQRIATTEWVNDKVSAMSVTVDSALSSYSANPVQNKVITDELQNYMKVDGTTPFTGAVSFPNGKSIDDYMPKSGGTFTSAITLAVAPITGDNSTKIPNTAWVNTAINNAMASGITVDSTITASSTHPVESAAIYAALANKADIGGTSTITAATPAANSDGTDVATTEWVNDKIDTKSAVSVSASGSSTNEIEYITIDGTAYKIKDTVTTVDTSIAAGGSNPVSGDAINTALAGKSTVSASATGSSTTEINYITIDSTEYKIGGSYLPTTGGTLSGKLTISSGGLQVSTDDVTVDDGDFTITKGNAILTEGDLTLTLGNATLTKGNLTLSDGNVTVTGSTLTTPKNITVSSTATVDTSKSDVFALTLSDVSCTISFSNLIAGHIFICYLTNPSDTCTAITWGTTVYWDSGTAPDVPASGSQVAVTFMYIDGKLYGFVSGKDFATA